MTTSQALTRICITRIANGNWTLTLTNVEGCYYKVFQGAIDADPDGPKLILSRILNLRPHILIQKTKTMGKIWV